MVGWLVNSDWASVFFFFCWFALRYSIVKVGTRMIKERKKSMISYDTYSIVQLGRGFFGGRPDGEGPNVGYNNMNCWLVGGVGGGFFFLIGGGRVPYGR